MISIRSITRIIVKKKDALRAINVILKASLPQIKNFFRDDGTLEIVVYTNKVTVFKKSLDEYKIQFDVTPSTGIFSSIFKNKNRVGLLVGAILLLVMSLFSSRFIWEINIYGNEMITDEQILTSLEKTGITLGTYIPNIDYKSVHNKILLEYQEISWVSVNITGNVANVQVKETLKDEEALKEGYANLVAKSDGHIVLINVIDGVKKISIGDVVKKGDLLISGVINSNSQGTRYVKAEGEVMAYVNKEINIKIPFNQEFKTYTGKVTTYNNIEIFNKNLFFLRNSSNCDGFYDTIEKKEQIVLFNRIKLPIYKTVYKSYEYKMIDTNYSKEQAVDVAFKRLRDEMDNLLKNSELISKELTTSYDDDNFYIECDLYCLENIATSVDFFVENNGG